MPNKIDQFNQAVRSIVTLAFAAGVLYGFIVSKLISPEVFVPLASGVITWWFVRDQAAATTKEAVNLLNTAPPQQIQPAANGTTTTTTTTVKETP